VKGCSGASSRSLLPAIVWSVRAIAFQIYARLCLDLIRNTVATATAPSLDRRYERVSASKRLALSAACRGAASSADMEDCDDA